MKEYRKVIIYYGICFLPDGNAMCQRAKAIANFIKHEKYVPVIIGFNKNGTQEKFYINSILCYTIPYPNNLKTWIMFITSIKPIIKIINEIGKDNVEGIIASDLKIFQLIKMKLVCKKNKTKFILDILDWYGKSHDKFPKNIIKDLDTFFTMRLLFYTVNRCITVSTNLYIKFNNFNINCVRIPMVYSRYKEKKNFVKKNKLRFVFAGKPGNFCEKEKLDWILEIFHELKYDFELLIIGVESKVFFDFNPKMKQYFDHRMKFYGILPYESCRRLIGNSDFYLLIREKNRLSDYGFSTKLMESFQFKIPLIATNTGDVGMFVKDGYNGFICEANKMSFKDKIENIFAQSNFDILELKENIDSSLLHESNYYAEFKKVIR